MYTGSSVSGLGIATSSPGRIFFTAGPVRSLCWVTQHPATLSGHETRSRCLGRVGGRHVANRNYSDLFQHAEALSSLHSQHMMPSTSEVHTIGCTTVGNIHQDLNSLDATKKSDALPNSIICPLQ